MGIQVSKTQVSGGSFFMRPGDTFLYSVEDPRGRITKHSSSNPNLDWLSWVSLNKGDEGKKHMIYEGKVTELVTRDGKVFYRYYFTKMWTSPDRFSKDGVGVIGPWSWESQGAGSWYQNFFFGTENNAPRMLWVNPKGKDFPANHTWESSAVHSIAAPKELPSDDPNIGVNGDFSRLSNSEILDFLNKYAMNASYTGRTSTPEIQEASKEFLAMPKQQLESVYKQGESAILGSMEGSMITVTYRRQDGMPESEKMSIQSFLNNGITLIKDKENVREYTGLLADHGADYDSIYQEEKSTIDTHRKDLIGKHGFGEEIVMKDVEITGGNVSFANPRTDIPFVNVKDPMDTDQITMDAGFAKIQNIIQNNPAIEGWTQVKIRDSNGNDNVNTIFYNNVSIADRVVHEADDMGDKKYVSGLVRGARQLDVVGSEDKKVGTSQYLSVNLSRKEYPENTLSNVITMRRRVLGMLSAYIQNNHSIRGTGGVLDMLRGGSDVASRMFLLSEALKAHEIALNKSIKSREKIFSTTQMNEGFTNERIKEDNEIDRLRTTIEQNEAIVDQISYESTITSAQFVGALLSAGAFFAISFYSLRK